MFLRHLAGYLPAHLVKALVAFAGVYIFTRLLDPADFGRYTLALSATAFGGHVVFSWIEAALARRYAAAEVKGEVSIELATAYWNFAVIAAAVLVLSAGVFAFAPMSGDIQMIVAIGLGKFLADSLLHIGLIVHRAARDVPRFVALDVTRNLVGFAVGVAAVVWTGLEGAGPLLGLLVGCLVALVFDLPYMLPQARRGHYDPERAKAALSFGTAAAIGIALEQILSVADRFLIAYFLGEAETGVYAAGYSLGNRFLDMMFIWVGLAAAPLTVAALEHGGLERMREIARHYASTLIVLALPGAVGLAMVAEPLAAVMVGEDYRERATPIIPWIAAAAALSGFMTYYLREAFTLTQRTGLFALALSVPAILNVLLNLWWIPAYGLMGAVASTVVAYMAGVLVVWVGGRRLIALPMPWGTLGKACFACAVMAVAVWLTPSWGGAFGALMLKAGVGAIVYAGLGLALNLAGCRAWLEGRRAVRPTA